MRVLSVVKHVSGRLGVVCDESGGKVRVKWSEGDEVSDWMDKSEFILIDDEKY